MSLKIYGKFIFQRFKSNSFVRNAEVREADTGSYSFYIRPFITFWSLQSLSFDVINNLKTVPKQREDNYPRYVLEKLARTWHLESPKDSDWFDKKNIYDELKKDLIAKLESKFLSIDSNGKYFYLR